MELMYARGDAGENAALCYVWRHASHVGGAGMLKTWIVR